MLINKIYVEFGPPWLLVFVLLSIFTLFSKGDNLVETNKEVFYTGERPNYVECPSELPLGSGVYPLTTELCSSKYTYCDDGVVIGGNCPEALFFNPETLSCDDLTLVDSCEKKYGTKIGKSSEEGRPFEDNPSYNDCTQRPCDFYPNGEDNADGSTYVFCNDGTSVIRKCTKGYAFDHTIADCLPKKEARKWRPPKLGNGKNEPDNPLNTRSKDDPNPVVYRGKPPPSLVIEPGSGAKVIQLPFKDADKNKTLVWSKWVICPNATFITKVTKEGSICSFPNANHPRLAGLEDRDNNMDFDVERGSLGIQEPVEEHFFPHPAESLKINPINCARSKDNKGALNSMARSSDGVELLCSNSKETPPDGAEFCPITTAMCGISYLYHDVNKDVVSVRARCCTVRNPLFKPEEELAHISSFSNKFEESWRKFQFETGVYGVTISMEDKPLEVFYTSVGYTLDMMKEDLESSLKEKIDCVEKKNCIYQWPKFKFKSKDVIKTKKMVMVPPNSKTKLFQVFAQIGYIRVYTNKFIEVVEHFDTNRLYEEVRTIPDTDLSAEKQRKPEKSRPPKVNDLDELPEKERKGSGPIIATNMDDEKIFQPTKVCPFHNLQSSKYAQKEPSNTVILSSPIIYDIGQWGKWNNCSREAFISKVRQISHEVKKAEDVDKAGVVQLGFGCKTVLKPTEDEELQELDFVNPGFKKKAWSKDSWEGGECEHGLFVGFQIKTGSKSATDMAGVMEMRLICSCDKADLNNAADEKGQIRDEKGQMKDDKGQMRDEKGQMRDEKGQMRDEKGQMRDEKPRGDNNGKPGKGSTFKEDTDRDDDYDFVEVVTTRKKGSGKDVDTIKIMPKKDGWTEEQICEPFQALQGVVLQEHPLKTDLKKYDNHGLTNVKMKCTEVASPAENCDVKQKKVHVSRCNNRENIKRVCLYNVSVGVSYNSNPETPAIANVLESVGHTLGCVIPSLKQRVRRKCPDSEDYKEPIWQSGTVIAGHISVPANSKTDIYQIVGECGPYKIRTNRFIKITSGEEEEEYDLPLPVIETKAPCWKDFMEFLPVVEKEKRLPLLKFHDDFPITNFTNTAGGIILHSPKVTDFGKWDPSEEWKYCPSDTYITGVAANRYQASNADHLGIAQIGFRCVNPKTGKEANVLTMKTPGVKGLNKDALKNWANCSGNGAAAHGFQLYTQPPQAKNVDDVATDGVLIKCSSGEVAVVEFDRSNQDNEDGQVHTGLWSDPQTCQPKQALCGFMGQFEAFEKPDEDNKVIDNTGLNNLQMKCCDVPHPALVCEPEVKRILVGHCDNNATEQRPCLVKLEIGIGYTYNSLGSLRRNFYESIGFTKECAGKILSKTFERDPKCLTEKRDCEIDWENVPVQTWYGEDTFKDFVPVPGKKKTPVYQVQAHCDDYAVKTNKYVVNDLVRVLPMRDDTGRGVPCWEDNLPFKADPPSSGKIKAEPNPPIKPPRDPEKPEYDFVDDGAVLTSPVVNTTYPDETEEESWQYCNQPTYEDSWYADSVYVQREGSPNDRAGLVAIAFHCRNPKLTGEGDHVISGKTPGALILDEGVWDWKRCKCGAGVGFQISSVPAQQLGDDLAVESFKLSCSCSDPVWKRGYEFPNDLQEETGTWTKEQLCRPRQAICGLRTRSKPFKVMDNLLLWDNFGITQTKVKCCDVPNPAETCEPRQVLREIGVCENEDEDLNRRCIIDTVIGVTYDHNNEESKNLANFYESIGWGLDCVIPDLEKNIKKNMGTSSDNEGGKYRWNESKQQIWHQAGRIQDIIEIKDRTRTIVYQVVGQCGPYIVGTENFVREDTNMRNVDSVMEDAFRTKKPIRNLPVAGCWTVSLPFPARDYIDPVSNFNNQGYPFHGLPSPAKFTLSNMTTDGVEVEFPAVIPKKTVANGVRTECSEGNYLVGFASEKRRVAEDDLGTVHYLARCKKLTNVTQPKNLLGDEDKDKRGKVKGRRQSDENNDDNGSSKSQKKGKNGKEELLVQHPVESFDKSKLNSMYQGCIDGVLVGYQAQNSDKSSTDDVGIDDIRMMCSVGKPLDPYAKPTKSWTDAVESCRPYQAMCAVSAKFGPKSVGDWEKVDGTGISQIRMACCDVPSPAIEHCPANPTNPKETQRLVAVCNNLQYDVDRECKSEVDVGVTYDFEENPEESKMHLSVGYSIPCVISDLKKTFQNAKRIECSTGNSCFDWKKEINSKIFQHGLTSYKNSTRVRPNVRMDVYQTVAKFNDLLVLSNKFEIVVNDNNGEEIGRRKFTIPLDKFPDISEKPYCDHFDKGRKRPKTSDSGKLLPDNMISPKKDEGKSIPQTNSWLPSENMKDIDGTDVVSTLPPNILNRDDDDVKAEPPVWEDWFNCPQDSFVSYISAEDGGKKRVVTGFGFKCINPDDGGLHDTINVGSESPKKRKEGSLGKPTKTPGWKSTKPVDESDEPLKIGGKPTESTSGGLNDVSENIPRGTAKPNEKDEGCNCPEFLHSIVIGVKTITSQKSGTLGALKPVCPCHQNISPDKKIGDGKVIETLVCKDRQALCGFQVQKYPKEGEISRIRAACCDLPSPLECDAKEALYRAVVCDNSNFDKERKCSFNLDVGVTYDFEKFPEQIKLQEALNWKLDCMALALPEIFADDLDRGKETGKDWVKAAEMSPLGPEWNLIQTAPHEITVKPWTRLEIFQVVGQCDMYKTYTDRLLITESVTNTGAIRNTPKELGKSDGDPSLTGTLQRKTPECWLDRLPLVGNNVLLNSLKPPLGDDGYHDFEPSDKGDPLYKLDDTSPRTGFLLRAKAPRNTSDDVYKNEDLAALILCQEGTYIRKFTGGPGEGTHIMCTTPNYTTPNTRSFNKAGVPKGHKYQQTTPAAFVGMIKDPTNDNKDPKDIDKTLIPSIPQKGKSDAWNDEETKGKPKKDSGGGSPSQHCHPGQAICGIQAGKKLGAVCCTVENPAEICEPEERTVLSAVCDNTRDSRKRKCEVKIGVGVAYNFEESPVSSYFYTSVGYIPECLRTLKQRFRNMPCVAKGSCNYGWGSAPCQIWTKMHPTTEVTEVEPYLKVEYYQKIGVCNFPDGQLVVSAPVVERRVVTKAGKLVSSSELVVVKTGEAGKKLEHCKLKFMDLSAKPDPSPVEDYAPIKLKSKFPIESEAIPGSRFHGMQEADYYDYFSDDLTKDTSIVLSGPIDLDVDLNLKPRWKKWSECMPDSYVTQMEAYFSTLTKEKDYKTKLDALGVNQVILTCSDNKGQRTNELELFTEKTMKSPPDNSRKYKACQNGCVAVGLEVQMRGYQGPVKDDNAYVNLKQLCSCGKHAVNDLSSSAIPRDYISGIWDTPQVCQPRQALCGYKWQQTEFEQVDESDMMKTTEAFLLYDNLGITGLKAKCCNIPSPVLPCEPSEERVFIAECDNSVVSKGARMCYIEVDVGLSYIYQKDGQNIPEFYESVGWNLDCLKDELYEKFKTKIGISQNAKELDWGKTKMSKIWNRAVSGTLDLSLTPQAKHKVYQIVGKCGIYRVHTNIFIEISGKNDMGGKTIVSTVGNDSPDPCWADLSPVKARNWAYHVRNNLVPNFEIYYKTYGNKGIPWKAEDGSGRQGYQFSSSPNPYLPSIKWEDLHICPIDSYIRSFSVRRFVNENADYMPQKKDVYGVVSVAYHCMYPNMSVAEEKIYTSRVFEKGAGERRKENRRIEKHDAPGGRYQYCLGAAMGAEVESIISPKRLVDNYGILDVRFLCRTIGKDSDFAHKVDLIGVEINSPSVKEHAVCKTKQALCSFQGAFSDSISKTSDNFAMSQLKMGCCNVPSPLESGRPETKLTLAATCDNTLYTSQRKCHYVLGIGIQYDIKSEREASYFYLSVGYTPVCLAKQLKTTFPELARFSPQVFQEMAAMKVTITVEPRTRVDVYQLVGKLSPVLVLTNFIQTVKFDRRLKEINRVNTTETSNLPEIVKKECDDIPPEPSKVEKVAKIENFEAPKFFDEKCLFEELLDATTYKLSPDNYTVIEGARDVAIEVNHKTTWNDYEWANCPGESVVTGFDIKSGEKMVQVVASKPEDEDKSESDKFGVGAIALQCESIRKRGYEKKVIFHVAKGTAFGKSDFIGSIPNQLRGGYFCKDGVAVGLTHEIQQWRKSQDDEAMVDFQLYCSSGDMAWQNGDDSSDYDDERTNKVGSGGYWRDSTTGKVWGARNESGRDFVREDKEKTKDKGWTEPGYCKPRQAICGFTIQAQQSATDSIRKHDNIAMTNVRAKCCPVESPVQLCAPAEKLTLIGECENSKGRSKKFCALDLFVGLTYDRSKSENARAIKIYDEIGWNLPCIKDSLAESFAQSMKASKYYNWNAKKNAKCWNEIQKKSRVLTADPGMNVKMFQVIGSCGFYKVYTGKFVERQDDARGTMTKENGLDLDNDIGSDGWDPPCWEGSTPMRGMDFLVSKISSPVTCPWRSSSRFQCTSEEILLRRQKYDNAFRDGYVISTPHPDLPRRTWGGWKFCPMGTYIRGWASVAAGQAYRKEKCKNDYSGVVFIKGICQGPEGNYNTTELSLLQPQSTWNEPKWTKKGRYGHLYCVGAGIGIQGIIRPNKGKSKNEKENSPKHDRWYFHDTKLVCSCGGDAGFIREGLDPIDVKQNERNSLTKEQVLESCRPGYSLCGLRVSWGAGNSGDFRTQDGFGVSNMQGLCCPVPSPVKKCKNMAEKLILASQCDNYAGTATRRCIFNIAMGIAYNYEDYQSESLFYESNGFTAACISYEVKKTFTENKPKPCSETGCKYKWNDAPIRIWQGSGTVSQTIRVQPKQRFKIYQVVSECSSGIIVLTNQFVQVTTDANGKELSRVAATVDEMPASDKKICEIV